MPRESVIHAPVNHPAAVQLIQTRIVLDTVVQVYEAPVLLEEGLEISEQVSITLVAHSTTLAGRRVYVNVSECRRYFPFGPRESTASAKGQRAWVIISTSTTSQSQA